MFTVLPSRALPPPPCAPWEADDFLSRPPVSVVSAVREFSGPVLVLGAGGKMGLHLSLTLRAAALAAGRGDLRVIAVSRFSTLRDRESFTRGGVETVACDLSDEAAVAALPEAGVVFYLAGVKFGTASSPELLERMNVTVARLVARRYHRSKIVAFSTGCVYPFVDVGSSGADESVPPAPLGDYAVSCLRREEAFASVAREHQTPVVLIRLNYAVEFRYGVLLDIASKVKAGQPIDLSMGHVNVIWQSDAIAQVIQSAALARAPAFPLNIAGAEVLRVRDIASAFGALLERSPVFTGSEQSTAWLNDASRSHRLFGAPSISFDQM
jgi:nucleoside-diphosphate-sugar epimerase